jgi:ribonuclease HIII
VIAAVYTDESITAILREKGVRDSKAISSSKRIEGLAKIIKQAVEGRFAVVKIGPEAYNRLYTSMGNVNRMLAWGHARALENLLDKVPDCPRALSDQFGPKRQIEQALLKKGRKIKLEQRPKAESDPAVAAASIIARDVFLKAMEELGKPYGVEIPRGASAKVREVAVNLVQAHGAPVLLKTVKCHFKTTDQVLAASGLTRGDLSA